VKPSPAFLSKLAHPSFLPVFVFLATMVLDTENPLVALYILQNSIWWVETAGLDGIHVTEDRNATSQFWHTWRARLQKIYPHLAIVSE
jgi:hypothetical protein